MSQFIEQTTVITFCKLILDVFIGLMAWRRTDDKRVSDPMKTRYSDA